MAVKIDEQTKLVALAKIKLGQKPREVSDELGISYSQALRLSKDLTEAERKNATLELFDLPELTLQTLLKAVKENLAIPGEVFGIEEAIEGEIANLQDEIDGLKALDENFTEAAGVLANKIKEIALTSSTPDTVYMLAKALSELQVSFFAKSTNVQVNNFDTAKYEEFLSD